MQVVRGDPQPEGGVRGQTSQCVACGQQSVVDVESRGGWTRSGARAATATCSPRRHRRSHARGGYGQKRHLCGVPFVTTRPHQVGYQSPPECRVQMQTLQQVQTYCQWEGRGGARGRGRFKLSSHSSPHTLPSPPSQRDTSLCNHGTHLHHSQRFALLCFHRISE